MTGNTGIHKQMIGDGGEQAELLQGCVEHRNIYFSKYLI